LDVDPGIDDAIAIVTALSSDEIEVVGIATVYGNVLPRVGMLNTLKVLELMDRMDIPVVIGAKRPLKKGLVPSRIRKRREISHGKWGLGGLHVNSPIIDESFNKRIGNNMNYHDMLSTNVNNKNFVGFIDEIINYYRDHEISIVATGPLTNIAQAIRDRPEFIRKIGQLSIMGGAYGLAGNINGNTTGYAEFNFYCDPEAARVVLSSPGLNSKIKVVGLDVTQHPTCRLDKEFINRVRSSINEGKISPTSEFILALLEFKSSYNTIFHLHDVLAVLLYERPSYFSFRRGNIDITLKGKFRGRSEFIDDKISGNVQVAVVVNEYGFKSFLYSRLVNRE
jgi:inosine-uridine nucleoside N-ribohydrolase